MGFSVVLEPPSFVFQLSSSGVILAVGPSPFVDCEKGSFGWKLFKFQSKDLLVHLILGVKGYPFLLCDVSLSFLIEDEPFFFSQGGWFDILLVEPAFTSGVIIGMQIFVEKVYFILVNAVYNDEDGYLRFGGIWIYLYSGFMNKDGDVCKMFDDCPQSKKDLFEECQAMDFLAVVMVLVFMELRLPFGVFQKKCMVADSLPLVKKVDLFAYFKVLEKNAMSLVKMNVWEILCAGTRFEDGGVCLIQIANAIVDGILFVIWHGTMIDPVSHGLSHFIAKATSREIMVVMLRIGCCWDGLYILEKLVSFLNLIYDLRFVEVESGRDDCLVMICGDLHDGQPDGFAIETEMGVNMVCTVLCNVTRPLTSKLRILQWFFEARLWVMGSSLTISYGKWVVSKCAMCNGAIATVDRFGFITLCMVLAGMPRQEFEVFQRFVGESFIVLDKLPLRGWVFPDGFVSTVFVETMQFYRLNSIVVTYLHGRVGGVIWVFLPRENLLWVHDVLSSVSSFVSFFKNRCDGELDDVICKAVAGYQSDWFGLGYSRQACGCDLPENGMVDGEGWFVGISTLLMARSWNAYWNILLIFLPHAEHLIDAVLPWMFMT